MKGWEDREGMTGLRTSLGQIGLHPALYLPPPHAVLKDWELGS
jgi:hypothetical protein